MLPNDNRCLYVATTPPPARPVARPALVSPRRRVWCGYRWDRGSRYLL